MKNKAKSLLGLVLVVGLTWAVADAVKSDKSTARPVEKSAISAGENDQCKRPVADCAKPSGAHEKAMGSEEKGMEGGKMHSEADCPKSADCPKGMHSAKSGQCCKKSAGGEAKSGHSHGSTDHKPVEAVKAKDPAVK